MGPVAFPGFENLFFLQLPSGNRRAYFAEFSAAEDCIALSLAEAVPTRTPQVTWYMGTAEPGDVVWTSNLHPMIVHARVVDLLDHHRFTGWGTFNVDVYAKSGRKVPGYYGISIHGRCGRVDLSRSAIELTHSPGGWWPEFKGYFFDEASWDGSDLFMDFGLRFVTHRVVHVFKKAKVKNIAVCALSERRVSTGVYSRGLPADFSERLRTAYATAGVEPPAWIVENYL